MSRPSPLPLRIGMTLRTGQPLVAGTLFTWILIAPIVWVLRDGLGPDSVRSSGIHAISRFLTTFYWGPVALALLAATIFLRPRRPRSERAAGPPDPPRE